MGLIDTLSAGFQSVNRRLWILAIPIVLDVLLWVGPRVTAEPALANAIDQAVEANASMAQSLGMDEVAFEALARSVLINGTGIGHLEGYLAGPTIPALTGPLERMLASPIPFTIVSAPLPSMLKPYPPPPGSQTTEVVIGSVLAIAPIWLVFVLCSTALAALYLTVLGRAVRTEPSGSRPLLADVARTWVALAGWILVAWVFLLLIMFPLTALAMLVSALVPVAGAVILSVVMAVPLWTRVYFYFWEAAVVVSGRTMLAAALSSLRTVHGQFWSVLGFVVLVYFILVGITFGLQRVIQLQPWLILPAILVNAYVATGLTAAGMVFYRERAARRQPAATLP